MVTDVILCVILRMRLIYKCNYKTIDTETAFLHAVLDKEIYTKISEGVAGVHEEYYM